MKPKEPSSPHSPARDLKEKIARKCAVLKSTIARRLDLEPPVQEESISLPDSAEQSLSSRRPAKDYALPLREEALSGIHFFALASRIWEIAIVSVAVDCIIVTAFYRNSPHPIDSSRLQQMAFVCVLISLASMSKDLIFAGLDKIRRLQDHLSFQTNKRNTVIAIAIFALFIIAELAVRLSASQMVSLGAGLILLLGALHSGYRLIREKIEQDRHFAKDRVLWLEEANKQIFVMHIVPITLSRVVIILGVIQSVVHQQGPLAFLPYLCVGVALLSAHRPRREGFVTNCGKCARWTSRALKSYGFCPSCDRKQFQLREDSTSMSSGETAPDTGRPDPLKTVPPPGKKRTTSRSRPSSEKTMSLT